MEFEPLGVDRYSHIVILTGAGISVASGLPTFRGLGGLYRENVEWISDARNLPDSLPKVWELYGSLRGAIAAAQPSKAHSAIAELEKRREPGSVVVVTQNVDGLHQRAGSGTVYEIHGSLMRSRCMNRGCGSQPFADARVPDGQLLRCGTCTQPLRPDIVMFSEQLPVEAEHFTKRALREVDLFIAIGTSGSVFPAASYVNSAAYVGARTVLINQAPMDPHNSAFKEQYLGDADVLVPILLR